MGNIDIAVALMGLGEGAVHEILCESPMTLMKGY